MTNVLSPAVDAIMDDLMWCSSATRPHAVLSRPNLSGELFWSVVQCSWPTFDAIPHAQFASRFRRERDGWSPACMLDDARTIYDELPERITIYRGQDRHARAGLSWTLDIDVARQFARGHRGISVANPVVLKAVVMRRSVAFCCTERTEAEVVLFNAPRRKTTLLGASPTIPAS